MCDLWGGLGLICGVYLWGVLDVLCGVILDGDLWGELWCDLSWVMCGVIWV